MPNLFEEGKKRQFMNLSYNSQDYSNDGDREDLERERSEL